VLQLRREAIRNSSMARAGILLTPSHS